LGLASLGLFLTSAPVSAASLCNCCTTGSAEDGDNPLYGISLLGLDLKDAVRPDLEGVRRLLENSRRGVEKDRKASARDFRKGRIDNATLAANIKRYENAIVNYYLGLRIYRDRLAAVPKK
jgi:hypothetical protein